MRGYPHPLSGTISPTESPSRIPSFRVQNGWVPPLWCPEVPPHPIRSRPLLRSREGSSSLRPTPPTHVRRWGEYPLSSKGGYPPCPPVLHLSFLTFVWNSRRSAAISGQCQTGGYPPLAVIRSPPTPHAQGLGHTPPPTPSTHGGWGYPPFMSFSLV